MTQATEFISHKDQHFVVSSTLYLNLIVNILIKNAMFKYHLGQKTNDTEFIALYILGSRVIAIGGPLNTYQYRVQGN